MHPSRVTLIALLLGVALAVAGAAAARHAAHPAPPTTRLDARIPLRGGTVDGNTPTGFLTYSVPRHGTPTVLVTLRHVVPSPGAYEIRIDGRRLASIRVTHGSGRVAIRRRIAVNVQRSRITVELRDTHAIVLKSFQRRTGSDLFVVSAAAGTLAGNVLTLHGVPAVSTYFADRPSRRTGTFATSDLAQRWAGAGFASDPPNAALSITNGRKDADTVILELRHPRFSGHTLSFRTRQLGSPSPGMASMRLRADPRVPSRFGPSALFIDSDGYQDCWGALYNLTNDTYNLTSSSTDSHTDWGTSPPSSVAPNTMSGSWEGESSTFHACHALASYADATGNGDSISTETYMSWNMSDADVWCNTTGGVACSCYTVWSPNQDDWIVTYYVAPPGSDYVEVACWNGEIGG